MSSPAGRSYSGLPADERLARRRQRLLEVGLDILGAPDGPGDLTLRAVCQRSGLAQRYFYESFTDKDEFAVAIFDWAIEGLASTIEAEVAAAPPRLQVRAGITSVVRAVNADRRIGQLLYSPSQVNPVLVRKRFEATAMFVSLFAQHLYDWFRRDDQGNLPVLAHFVVGGVGQAVSAWLHGDVAVDEGELVEQLVDMLLAHGPAGSAQR
ncbi:AcrR family transcriptional regulator [Mycobacteroides chelonae]|nr:AcrR family transcriptional regulator [Mycobacteroides chelonae]